MKRMLVTIAAGGLLLLAGCGGGQAATPAAAPTTAPTTQAPVATPVDEGPGMTQFSPRGAEVETIGGRQATVKNNAGGYALDFTVDTITPDPQPCAHSAYSPLDPPFNGHRLAVAITVETRPSYNRATLSIDPFAGQNFHYVSPNGQVTQTLQRATATTCTVTELPSNLLPGSTYKGTVMLDVPATSGILVLDANGGAVTGVSNVFEWKFPA